MHTHRGWTFWSSAGLTMVSALLFSAPHSSSLLSFDLGELAPATAIGAAALLTIAIAFAASCRHLGVATIAASLGTVLGLLHGMLFAATNIEQLWTAGLVALFWLAATLATLLGGRDQSRQVLLQSMQQQSLPQLVVDAEARIQLANDAFAALVGIERDSLIGEELCSFIDRADWEALGNKAESDESSSSEATNGAFAEEPVALNVAGGQTHWVLLGAIPTDGLSSGALLITCWDQTQSHSRLSEQVQQVADLQGLLHQSHDIVLRLNAEGLIVSTNERSRLVLGKAVANLDITALLDDAQAYDFEQARSKCLNSGTTITIKRLQLHPTHRDAPIFVDAKLQCSQQGPAKLLLTGNSVKHHMSAELELQQSNSLLERVFAESPDAIALYRRSDHSALRVNPGFTTVFGYSADAIIGQPDSLLKLWADPETRIDAQEQFLRSHYDTRIQGKLARQNNSVFDAEILLRQVHTEGEECLLLIARDISEQLDIDRARAANEQMFQQTFEFSPDGIAILRKQDAVIIDVNPAMVEASGYEKSQLLDRSLFELGVMADLSEMQPSDLLLKQVHHFDDIEMTFKTKSGSHAPALVSAREFDLNGEAHLIAVAKDVQELRSAQARVARSEERFRGAFENAQLAMILMDLDGKIFLSNRFAQDLLSFSAAELNGLHISRLIPQEERIDLKESLTRILQDGEMRIRSERRMLCQNGLEIWTNFQIVLQLDSTEKNSYFIIQAADVTDIKLSQRRMERMAFYDTLTDLANRRLFQERLQHAIEHCQRSGRLSALLYLDLDQFKRVNDTLGHEAGDALLREVALRLAECVRTEDTVGRTGGDEFTVLLFDIEKSGDAGVVAEKILTSLREPIPISGHNLVVTTSIGVAIIPNDGRDANVVMKNADLAMYRAKDRGRNNFQFYAEDMNTKAVLRLRTENELREGLTRGEFILHHQPKYRISDGKIMGVECLVRWNHPTRGLLPPGEFIQVAEETGAIVNLGSWIIEAACQAGKRFADIADGDFSTAVNISPRQFRDPNLISHIRRCLRTSGLPPELLQVEITETMLMHDVEAASAIVARLHELGTFLAIDDFGTGYSSLNYLKKFPIQTVKVDRSFVTDIPHNSDDMAITAAVIAMAHRLNMDVVAEGVETEGQLQFLCENHCEFAQGYLFSKPVTAPELEALIREQFSPYSGEKLQTAKPPAQARPSARLELIGKTSREK
ncbi:MAG: EAL domain-containing protein [Pseudomonadales bacterium]